ncbi:hypothetical protein [Streptomyces sp. VRA16 Mangrove soil]|uniref:hypothetical protein n=1 Tax=Streptomyces sp. VRA16 Mangrove soil TaxID=2817434 RepID=UPI001A9FE601|nr:hypothetical protein [Streptomyces sp. VRA16 Mangrove soil]MBO1332272.1 hypothetical protein [Streptomyces sp. VRA16 Mangrove soil]
MSSRRGPASARNSRLARGGGRRTARARRGRRPGHLDIAALTLRLDVPDAVLEARRTARDKDGCRPRRRERTVSVALRAYAGFARSADKGRYGRSRQSPARASG